MHRRTLTALFAVVACKQPAQDECPACNLPQLAEPPPVACDPAEPRVCVDGEVVACQPEGVLGRGIRRCEAGCKHGRCVESCASDASKLIYVVDEEHELLAFDPRKLPGDPFRRIAKLTCDSAGTPQSMAVDRHGTAWVHYSNGPIYRVSIDDGSCERSSYVPDPSATHFGMGYVSDEAKGQTEKLFLSPADGANSLAFMNPDADDLTWHHAGTIAATRDLVPELTGTADAKLFGFFPIDDGMSFVQEIDRASGAAKGKRWALRTSPAFAFIEGYAFAQWAGVFYVFLTYDDGTTHSRVLTVDPATGKSRVVLDNLPYTITGAGVSTCAPGETR